MNACINQKNQIKKFHSRRKIDILRPAAFILKCINSLSSLVILTSADRLLKRLSNITQTSSHCITNHDTQEFAPIYNFNICFNFYNGGEQFNLFGVCEFEKVSLLGINRKMVTSKFSKLVLEKKSFKIYNFRCLYRKNCSGAYVRK